MINLTAFFQLLMGVSMTLVVVSIFISYLRHRSKEILSLLIFFALVALFAYTQSLPYYFSGGEISTVALWFIASIAAVHLIQISVFYTTFMRLNPIAQRVRFIVVTWLFLSLVVNIFLFFQEVRLPLLDESGFIFWNQHPFILWSMALSALVVGSFFSFVLYQNAQYGETRIAKAKAYVLSFDGIAWGIASFFYFPSESAVNTGIAFFFTITSFIATALVFWWARIIRKREDKPIETAP